MTNLSHLSLSRNRILSLNRLSHQKSITTLILDDNNIKNLGFPSFYLIDCFSFFIFFNLFVAPLCSITSLTHLSVKKNKIKNIHSGISKLCNLTYLDLAENHLTAFPPDVLGNLVAYFVFFLPFSPFFSLFLTASHLFYSICIDLLIFFMNYSL